MPDCYKCVYRREIPGDALSACAYPGNKIGMLDAFAPENVENMRILNIKANPFGITKGWFFWPTNYDPTWLLNCDGFKEKEKPHGRSTPPPIPTLE